ncbi:MAG: tRNA (N6-threonylcarbamoyladenosine(37)-N6)-methyltransferase TrmO, partial [candidate division Zixibacteria bacterium]|nr:tRNA (N6-threonylcarbamoyladenosine(37)-N6)-methyltransferase TrmO [candidate division Zixibacteria bacterium]
PYNSTKGMPIQPAGATGVKGTVEIEPEYVEGLQDVEEFSHIILLYHFHLSKGYSLKVTPFLDHDLHGVFATRAPKRPNSIGLSIVKLIDIEDNILHVEDVDIIDGTPLLDIKPYVPVFDYRKTEKVGWLTEVMLKSMTAKADERFE